MDLRNFEAVFERLTGDGRKPYPWQRRLYARFVQGGAAFPDRLDLPTGLGKTSAMAVWLAARLAGAALPRRLVYIVDRRAVVDQASAEAAKLAVNLDALIAEDAGGLILERLGLAPMTPDPGNGVHHLPISTLRGQFRDNGRWLEDPAACAIVVGTVDMIGSRLLFGGYGVSRKMRPVHAALLGVDSLVLLDEAHLAAPLEATLKSASKLIADDVGALRNDAVAVPTALRPLRLLTLSATGARKDDEIVLGLEEEDREDKVSGARLSAPKWVELLENVAPAKVAERLAGLAWDLRQDDEDKPRRVVVFCNSRRTAQAVEARLADQVKKTYGKAARLTALLVGERRVLEREALAREPAFARFLAGAEQPASGEPGFLVATSAGEVGVDLDADDLVCDLVPWERMVQRFGRVNRRAKPGVARVKVVPVADDKETEDKVDEPRLEVLKRPFDRDLWTCDAHKRFDASPNGLLALKQNPAAAKVLQDATTAEPLRPPLTRPEVEAWALTSLETHTGRPKVEPWLRGWIDKDPQTRMVWRRWLPLRKNEAKAEATAELKAYLSEHARPHASEVLEAATYTVAKLLMDRAKAVLAAQAKSPVPEASDTEDVSEAGGLAPVHPVVVVVLDAENEVRTVYDVRALADLRGGAKTLEREIAGQTVVVDARLGGLDENGLLDPGSDERPVSKEKIGTASDVHLSDPPGKTVGALGRAVGPGWRVMASATATPPSPPEGDKTWKLSAFLWSSGEDDAGLHLWVWVWRGGEVKSGDPAIGAGPQPLNQHQEEVAEVVRIIAVRLGLDPAYAAVLKASALAHDLGKGRPVWQDAMGAPTTERPYAKVGGRSNGAALNGYRHEFGSLMQVIADERRYLGALGVDDPDSAELAKHLIVSHHGYGRPVIKPYDPDKDCPPARAVVEAREVALRFARLQARWGPWGLAWWEALLRAADRSASSALNARTPPEAEGSAGEDAHG